MYIQIPLRWCSLLCNTFFVLDFLVSCFFVVVVDVVALFHCVYFVCAQLHIERTALALFRHLVERKKTSWKIELIEDIGDALASPYVADVATAAHHSRHRQRHCDRTLIAISSNRFNWLYGEQLNLFIWARWIRLLEHRTDGDGKTIKFTFVLPINLNVLTTKSFAWSIWATLLKTHFFLSARSLSLSHYVRLYGIYFKNDNNEH